VSIAGACSQGWIFKIVLLTFFCSQIKYASPGFVQDSSDRTLPLCWKADFPVRWNNNGTISTVSLEREFIRQLCH
jgi:hypothetical protein